MRNICRFILGKSGWKIEGTLDYPNKCILCVAPHTSNWDLIIGKMIYLSLGRESYFLIKKSWFFFPMSLIFRGIGGIPVDRSKKTSLTTQLAEEFERRDTFELAVTPEGTRKKTNEWKKGFYYIALEAKVPIIIVTLDYPAKRVVFEDVFYPTGDVESDMEKIKNYYVGIKGKHLDRFTT